MLLGARRLAPGTLVPRSVSGSCRVLRRSPWSAPFPPQPPPRLSPLCSAASLVLWRSQTPPWRTRPAYGYSPSRTGLPAQTPKRSPGSRAYCFSACLGSSTTPGPTSARDITPPAGVAFPLTEKGRRPVLSFRSSIAQPTDASVYASTCCLTAARARLEVRMESLLLSCRALSSPTTCRFIPAHSAPGSPRLSRLSKSRDAQGSPHPLSISQTERSEGAADVKPWPDKGPCDVGCGSTGTYRRSGQAPGRR